MRELVEIPVVFVQGPLEEVLVDRFDNRVQPREGVVHEQARVDHARGRKAHLREEAHHDALFQHRRILCQVVEDDRFQSEKLLPGDIAIEVQPQTRFRLAPAPPSTRANADGASGFSPPAQVRLVVHVLAVALLQLCPVPGVHGQLDVLHRVRIEQVVGVSGGGGEVCARSDTSARSAAIANPENVRLRGLMRNLSMNDATARTARGTGRSSPTAVPGPDDAPDPACARE